MIRLRVHIKLAECEMNQKDLTELTGITKNTVTAYAKNTFKFIGRDHLDKMCKVFKCSVSDLIEYKDDEN